MAVSTNQVPQRDRLIFALDVADVDTARGLVRTLGPCVTFYKLGLELCMTGGYFDLVDELVAAGKRVFVDLKFFDVPVTVGRAVRRLRGRGVTFCTVHGNDAMLAEACASRGDVKVLAVTALTSLDRGDLDDLGFQCEPSQLVLSRARRAFAIGCDGVVSSGLEVPALRDQVNSQLLVVSPGIRPVENRPADDQKRTVDVRQAFLNGADYIVVGRPIRDAPDPRASAEAIQSTVASVFDATVDGVG